MKSRAGQLRPARTRIVALPSTATPQTRHLLVTSLPFLSRRRGAGFGPPSFYLSMSLLREGRGAGASAMPRRSREARPLSGRVSVALWAF